MKHKTVIRYEDLIENPEVILNQIGEMSDIDFSSVINKIKSNEDFKIEHVMAGNGIRKGDTIKFKATNVRSWSEKLKPASQNLFKTLSYNSLRKFNYL